MHALCALPERASCRRCAAAIRRARGGGAEAGEGHLDDGGGAEDGVGASGGGGVLEGAAEFADGGEVARERVCALAICPDLEER